MVSKSAFASPGKITTSSSWLPPGAPGSAPGSAFSSTTISPLEPDFLETTGPLVAVPRSGWGPLSEKQRSIWDRASVYLLNPTPSPLHCNVSFQLLNPGRCTTLRVGFNSLVLEEWVVTPEQPAEQQLRLPSIEVPGGGHHLWFEPQPHVPRESEIGHLEDRELGRQRRGIDPLSPV